MESQKRLLSALNRDFWTYASLILDSAAKRALEDACRKAGVTPPGRLTPAGDIRPAHFASQLAVAHAERGADFLRHAGYFCGSNAARNAEGNVLSPNEGASRLAGELAAECSTLAFEVSAKSHDRFEVAIISLTPLSAAIPEFAGGFVKGAAMRLNEGDLPRIAEKFAAGHKVWSATIEWNAAREGSRGRVTGGSRTRRK